MLRSYLFSARSVDALKQLDQTLETDPMAIVDYIDSLVPSLTLQVRLSTGGGVCGRSADLPTLAPCSSLALRRCDCRL